MEPDSVLRDEVDPDPVVEAAVQRLRSQLATLMAYDAWGRPLAWRQVARIAIGPLLADLRDSQTATAIAQAITQPQQVGGQVPAPSPTQSLDELPECFDGPAVALDDPEEPRLGPPAAALDLSAVTLDDPVVHLDEPASPYVGLGWPE